MIAGTCSLNRDAPTSDTLFIIQDITPHKELEAELDRVARKSAAISKAKSEFMDIVSHELKTPLNGIFGIAQLLELIGDQNTVELVHDLLSSARRLHRIIDEIIEYTSFDSSEVSTGETVNIMTLLFVTAEKYQLVARQNDLSFVIALNELLDADFLVDAKCLGKVVSVLLDNAVKFTSQGEIRFEANLIESAGNRASLNILIADTGHGMSERILANPFTPFQQDENSLNRSHEGLGLGLAIVGKLLKLIDGSIEFISTINRGTNVWLTIPVQRRLARTSEVL